MKAVGAFNQEKALVIVKTDGSFAALVVFRLSDCLARTQENFSSFRSSVVINSGEASVQVQCAAHCTTENRGLFRIPENRTS